MRCWSCQFENPPAMKFCGQCGTQLVQLCPHCSSENQPTFKFCGQCGTALTAPPPPGADPAGDSAQLAYPPEAQRQSYTPPHLAVKILRSRSALEGERRQVTVLFAARVSVALPISVWANTLRPCFTLYAAKLSLPPGSGA